ncbi:MAG: hypothetical protein ACP5HG_06600 [Anaerolineae bacterium]
MSKRNMILGSGLIVLVFLAVGVGLAFRGAPAVRLLAHYPWDVLVTEANTMNECAECHEAETFHTCETCHDDHGAIELADVPFFAYIAFTGDVPEPGFVLVDEVLPYTEHPHTHIPLLSFLAEQGVEDFETVTLMSNDGGFITIAQDQLTDEAWLLPYIDGIRFAAENLHVSTWLKGITRIVVVGSERPLTIDGSATSMGRLLIGPTRSVTVEQTDVMLASEVDGEVRRASTASRIEGAPVEAIVTQPDFRSLRVTTAAGDTHEIDRDAAEGAMLAYVRGEATLVLPERGRSEWIGGVVELTSEP